MSRKATAFVAAVCASIVSPHSQIPPQQDRTSSNQNFFSGHIIAILAAILFPVFARAREKARQTSCLSNLKQIGLGMLMYVQDNDEMFPTTGDYTSPTILMEPGGRMHWALVLQPYVMNTQIFSCPSVSANTIISGTDPSTMTHPDWPGGIKYAMNVYLNFQSLGTINRPSALLMFVDADRNYFRLQDANHYAWAWDRHNGGWNAAMADGSAKWFNLRWTGDMPAPAAGDYPVGHPAR